MGAHDDREMLEAAKEEVVRLEHEVELYKASAQAYNRLMWRLAVALGKADSDDPLVAVNAGELQAEALNTIHDAQQLQFQVSNTLEYLSHCAMLRMEPNKHKIKLTLEGESV